MEPNQIPAPRYWKVKCNKCGYSNITTVSAQKADQMALEHIDETGHVEVKVKEV
jgi:hypothetical protein